MWPPGVAQAGSEVAILISTISAAPPITMAGHTFWSCGKLYTLRRERQPGKRANDRELLGKILRINPDGSMPATIPLRFRHRRSPTGINRAIWSVGLRNPYTFTFHPVSGRMFINDVGQSSWEEINDGISGSNYGWSTCEGACVPPNANLRDPLFQYGHGNSATTGCAITGGAFYNPSTVNFPAEYVGKYFYAEFCTGWIRRFDPATDRHVLRDRNF